MSTALADLPTGRLRDLLLRLFVVLPPAQALGILLGGRLVETTGLLPTPAWLTGLVVVVGGAVSGCAVGLLVRPGGAGLRVPLVTSAALGAASVLLLAGLAALALPSTSAAPPAWGYPLGALWWVGVQSAVAWALWRVRSHPG